MLGLYGADVNLKDSTGDSALDRAGQRRNYEMLSYLKSVQTQNLRNH
ncbi:MAG: ankyrin repeat domain-containing protein [Candidatus Marinimicrobia bacterium]|nr:ankyrin repeat domain-containing protein [FCB group bacterium]MBL7025417.1 ankyrin repeat domain-containing protein [Candidatus Neomarinimicrobiota bacterium]